MLVFTSCSSMQKIGLGKDFNSTVNTGFIKKKLDNVAQPAPNFIEQISLDQPVLAENTQATEIKTKKETVSQPAIKDVSTSISIPAIEKASLTQIKYSILLDIEIEEVNNIKLIEYIDEWYGTRYCMGGSTKNCIDCSAFTQSFFSAMYNMTLPRTARSQYKFSNLISRTDMQEGDLLFFNTRGGVSHVGIYLQNNKFVHAGSSEGVTISDIFDPYWLKRFIGVGRVEKDVINP